MPAIFIGSALLAASIALELAPQLFTERLQYGLQVFFAFAAICVLFRPGPNHFVRSRKTRDMCIGFSILVPVFAAWLAYNNCMAVPLEIDTDGLYSFLLWGVFVFAAIPAWGQILLWFGLISREERESFRTIRGAE